MDLEVLGDIVSSSKAVDKFDDAKNAGRARVFDFDAAGSRTVANNSGGFAGGSSVGVDLLSLTFTELVALIKNCLDVANAVVHAPSLRDVEVGKRGVGEIGKDVTNTTKDVGKRTLGGGGSLDVGDGATRLGVGEDLIGGEFGVVAYDYIVNIILRF